MATTLTAIPSSISAGTTVKYTRTVSDYPANQGWTLAVVLAGVNWITATVAASGADFAVSILSTDTAKLAPGVYQWTERVTKAGESYDVGSGSVNVTMNLFTAAAGDAQSANEKLLVVVEAAIQKRATADMDAFTISTPTGTRMVTRMPLKELLALRNSLKSAIARAQNPGESGNRIHRVTFTGTSNEEN